MCLSVPLRNSSLANVSNRSSAEFKSVRMFRIGRSSVCSGPARPSGRPTARPWRRGVWGVQPPFPSARPPVRGGGGFGGCNPPFRSARAARSRTARAARYTTAGRSMCMEVPPRGEPAATSNQYQQQPAVAAASSIADDNSGKAAAKWAEARLWCWPGGGTVPPITKPWAEARV